ncbi:glutamate--tRNA ligase [Candidatus Saccharibacteria bacterium]|nr:glutamate--tRNA ligase [Candidatus Saccharibacteria bacterium]
MSEVARTRFAPSPTGYLHVGGARTALFAWLTAKQAGGQFLLRIEDTDRTRHVDEAEQHITDSLTWLGMTPDEKPLRQSQRLDIYKQWGQKLIEAGRAYADPTSETMLDQLRDQAKAAKKAFLYRENRPAQAPIWNGSQPLRFKSKPQAYKWRDEVMGELASSPEAIDDFILIKSDGYPTYNFAHIVDDYEQNISHVIRSQEFLPSVPKFLNLYEALKIKRPKLATLPYVMRPDGKKKLSKRDGARDILDYKREGFLPEALINFLATLGWNDGTEQEIFSVDELIKKFDLARVQRSGARFDEQRLIWMNGHYIRELPIDRLDQLAGAKSKKPTFAKSTVDRQKAVSSFWPPEAEEATDDYKKAVLGLVQERLKYLAELPQLTSFFFTEPKVEQILKLYQEPVDGQLQKNPPDYKTYLSAVIKELADSDFSAKDIQNRLNKLLDRLSTKPAILFPVIRIALTGSQVSPEIFGTLHVLGKEKTLARLQKALQAL